MSEANHHTHCATKLYLLCLAQDRSFSKAYRSMWWSFTKVIVKWLNGFYPE